MKKIVIISIVLALVIAGAIYASSLYERDDRIYETIPADDKKLPGDSMTEKAIENAANGKQRMDEESLPKENKPKANDIQGGVILEGSANQELKVK